MFVLKVHGEQADGSLTCRQVSGVHGDLDPRPQRELDQVLIQGVQQEVRELRQKTHDLGWVLWKHTCHNVMFHIDGYITRQNKHLFLLVFSVCGPIGFIKTYSNLSEIVEGVGGSAGFTGPLGFSRMSTIDWNVEKFESLSTEMWWYCLCACNTWDTIYTVLDERKYHHPACCLKQAFTLFSSYGLSHSSTWMQFHTLYIK